MIGMFQRSRTWRSTLPASEKLHGFGQFADVRKREVVAAGRRRDPLEQRSVLLRVIVLGDAVLAPHREAARSQGTHRRTSRSASKRNMPGCVVS